VRVSAHDGFSERRQRETGTHSRGAHLKYDDATPMQERASSETAIVQLNGKYTCASLERLPTPCDEDECLYASPTSGYKQVEFATSRESRLSSLVRPCAPRAHAFQCKCYHVIFSSGARRITALTHDMRDASPRAQSVV
jgi:hypothetical protein